MRWFRAALLSTTALVALDVSASAADLPLKAPVPAAAVARWTGCYVGLQAGFGSNSFDVSNAFAGRPGRPDPDFSDLGTTRADGGLIGGQAGCNYQSGRFVVGAEGEAWWLGTTSSRAISDSVLLISSPQQTTGFNLTMRNRWSAAFSLRAGVVVDRALVYGKIGVAAANFQYDAVGVAPYQGVASANATRNGLLLGAGAEFALTDHWSARVEYDHIDFGSHTQNLAGSITGPGVIDPGFVPIGVKERMDLVKVGVNYKL